MAKPIVVAGIDLETTDLDATKGAKIIELALSVHATINGHWKHLNTKTWRVNPGPGTEMSPHAQKVHGISLADLAGEPSFAEIAPKVLKILSKTDLLVAHNIDFDIPFMAVELLNNKFELPECDLFCTMEHGRLATGMGKLPNLGELCFAFDVDYDADAAHAADYDIDRTMECFIAGVKSGFYKPDILNKIEQEKAA